MSKVSILGICEKWYYLESNCIDELLKTFRVVKLIFYMKKKSKIHKTDKNSNPQTNKTHNDL